MLLFTLLALSPLRLQPAQSISYTAFARAHCSLLHGSAPPRLSLSSCQQQQRPEIFEASRQNLPGTSVRVLNFGGSEPQRYRTMTAKGTKTLNSQAKEDAVEEEAPPAATTVKRKLEGATVKSEDETQDKAPPAESKSSSAAAAGEAAAEEEEGVGEPEPAEDAPVAKKRRAAPKARAKASAGKKNASATATPPSGILKPDEEFTALATLAAKSRKFVGAHISAAGGVQNALNSCFNVKGQAFALFLKCQRKWVSPPLAETAIKGFKERCDQLEMDKAMQVLPHGSYLINVANPDKTKQENAYKALLDDLQRCEALGIKLYNIHPGSTVGDCSKEEGIRNIAEAVNRAHKDTKFVVVVLENMAGQKNVVGSKFEDLRDIIDLIEDKGRVGVCLDTCHLFAAGYDIRTPEKFEKVMEQFDDIVGYKYLKGMHLNDSKSQLSSGLDRHELLGKGHLGLEPFKYIMRHPTRFKDMPLILETPDPTEGSIWKQEIKQMYSFLEKEQQ
ncbi:endonuclease V, putative [Eimeria brunetti]|uniref:Endonuclease V, putative n=1 Tax=Eimeria brunetti TaxID=51314 RepID=U6LTR5_9EIME|nr:endonuclease V, putative [Eimeria brunetti]